MRPYEGPPIFPSAAAPSDDQQLRREATLNRRSFDRAEGTLEKRADARANYLENLRDAGLDSDAQQLEENWLAEIDGD